MPQPLQPILFDHELPPVTLPAQGVTVEARMAGEVAAVHAARRRARLQARYLELLLGLSLHGATDHEAASALGVPVSSICSTRAALRRQLAAHGHRIGPYREMNTVYVLAILLDEPLPPQEVPHAP